MNDLCLLETEALLLAGKLRHARPASNPVLVTTSILSTATESAGDRPRSPARAAATPRSRAARRAAQPSSATGMRRSGWSTARPHAAARSVAAAQTRPAARARAAAGSPRPPWRPAGSPQTPARRACAQVHTRARKAWRYAPRGSGSRRALALGRAHPLHVAYCHASKGHTGAAGCAHAPSAARSASASSSLVQTMHLTAGMHGHACRAGSCGGPVKQAARRGAQCASPSALRLHAEHGPGPGCARPGRARLQRGGRQVRQLRRQVLHLHHQPAQLVARAHGGLAHAHRKVAHRVRPAVVRQRGARLRAAAPPARRRAPAALRLTPGLQPAAASPRPYARGTDATSERRW